ncbi:unnamed protein product [Arabis nemorensis]|uniref:Uncharacterized protein n=1 Tax=Arabis nemorensis TaxID=586526 RepID=A0A565BHM7_9BRAS|nr:unnamed protein product [Arabis nemorensis]
MVDVEDLSVDHEPDPSDVTTYEVERATTALKPRVEHQKKIVMDKLKKFRKQCSREEKYKKVSKKKKP